MVDGYVMFLASDLALKRYPSITVGSTILVDNLSGPCCQGSAGRVVGPPLVGGLEGDLWLFGLIVSVAVGITRELRLFR